VFVDKVEQVPSRGPVLGVGEPDFHQTVHQLRLGPLTAHVFVLLLVLEHVLVDLVIVGLAVVGLELHPEARVPLPALALGHKNRLLVAREHMRPHPVSQALALVVQVLLVLEH
jgi:hypothetical protein